MTDNYRIVVSAENNPYLAWQAKLFYFSCITRLKHTPTIIVHERGSEWHPDFEDLVKAGGTVRSAPSYRVTAHGDDYVPRNTAGTLLHAAQTCAEQDEFIVLCDPDMIFVRQPEFLKSLSGEHYGYMNYDREPVAIAAEKMGIALKLIDSQKAELSCGVPYVIPVADAYRLAEVWLEAIDAFPPRQWEDSMHAFGLAVVKLGLKVTLTHIMSHNYWPDEMLYGDIIHYCYGDDSWSKRHYFTEDKVRRVWTPTVEAKRGTILGEILSQIQEARDFYSSFHQ